MRRLFLSVTVTCVLLAAVFSLARARDAGNEAVNFAPAREYRVFMNTDVVSAQDAAHQDNAKTAAAFESKYNELGRENWEFCANVNGMAVFKRPRP